MEGYMLVRDVLKSKSRELITVGKETSLKQAMERLIKHKISCLPVTDEDDKVVGIISDKDIFRRVYDTDCKFQTLTVGDCMTTEVIIGLPDDQLSYIAGVMTENRIRHVPVVDRSGIVGLISVGDIVKTQMENIKIENRYLKQYIEGSYPG
jgi:CBS domain-containing protein